VARQVVAGEERVEVLELARAPGRREVDRDVVAAARELGARLRHEPGTPGRSMPEDEHAPRGARGAAARARRRAGR
jgi:hypothetical protein